MPEYNKMPADSAPVPTNVRRGHRRSVFLANKSGGQVQPAPAPQPEVTVEDPNAPPGELGEREAAVQERLANKHKGEGTKPARREGEGSMNLSTLMELKNAFDAADTDGSGALDEDEFVGAFRSVQALAEGSTEEELQHLFMKIDANSDGTVDWDEFTNHILLEQARQMATEEDSGVEGELYIRSVNPDAKKGRRIVSKSTMETQEKPRLAFSSTDKQVDPHGHHYDMIERALYLNSIHAYVTAGRDGMLWCWNSHNLNPTRSLRNGGGWVTDIAHMASQPVAVCSVDRTISFYDSGRSSLEPLARINNLENVPMCAHWLRVSDCDMLLWGDDHGHINAYSFDDEWGSEHIAPGQGIEVGNKKLPGMKPHTPFKLHNDWVTKVFYLNHSGCLLSSSMDSTLRMVDLERKKPKWTVDEHLRGVYSFDFCRSYNFVASCGVERHILMWNPFTGRSVGALHGHSASVQDVMLNEEENQLISLSTDKVIKIWDIRSHKCLQTITDQHTYWPENRISAIMVNPRRRCLVTCGTRPEQWHRVSKDNVGTAPICASLYNCAFRQVVAGDVDCTVTVWSIDRGETVFSFSNLHGDGATTEPKMSAMCFDNTNRRMITGAQDGTVKMWNFNNGQCLKEFEGFGDAEVSCVTYLEEGPNRFVAAAGWNRKVCIWVDAPSSKVQVHHCMEGHTDDIICMTFCPPLILATGGYDGKVILWKIDGVIKAVLTPPDHETKCMDDKPIEKVLYLVKAGKTLAALGVDATVNFWRVSDGHLVYSLKTNHEGYGAAMATDADNDYLFTTDACGWIKCWDLRTVNFSRDPAEGVGEVSLMYEWQAHKQPVNSVSFVDSSTNHPGKYIVTGSIDGRVRFWSEEGILLGTFSGEHTWQIGEPQTYEEEMPYYLMAGNAEDAAAETVPEEVEEDINDTEEEVDYERLLLEQQRANLLAPRNQQQRKGHKFTFGATLERRLPLQKLSPIEPPSNIVRRSLSIGDVSSPSGRRQGSQQGQRQGGKGGSGKKW